MADNIDLNVEKLYSAYQKTYAAENTINDNKQVIYGYSKLELPDKKMYAKGFKYNETLIRPDYTKSMGLLQKAYGRDTEGTVEKTRKHIYKLMGILAESDSLARTYFEQMKEQDNQVIESFGSDVDTYITNVKDYSETAKTLSDAHSSEVPRVGKVLNTNYSSGTASYEHAGYADFTKTGYTVANVEHVSKDHVSSQRDFTKSIVGYYGSQPVEAKAFQGNRSYEVKAQIYNSPDSIFTLAK